MTIKEIPSQTIRAHELYGDFWFNSDPVPISALKGQVILLHFWDFSCLSSLRTLAYVKEWCRKYEPFGLTVVGVHTPKYPFAKNPEYVLKSIQRHGITYPVVVDNQYLISSSYEHRASPLLLLIDKRGFVRFQNAGEGNYDASEHAVQSLLHDAGVRDVLPVPMEPVREEDKPGAVCYRQTPELLMGYLRGSIGNTEGYSPESVVNYRDPGLYIDGKFYAGGNWLNGRDCLRFCGEGRTEGDIVLIYHGVEVHAVISPEGKPGFEVAVQQDGQYLTLDNKGDDIAIGGDGRSVLTISTPGLYNLTNNKEFGEHKLRLTCSSDSFALYAISFVSGVIPETVSHG
jgi:hypothetical protein